MIACTKGVIRSARYMDDGYAIAKDISTLQEVRRRLKEIADRAGLTINEKRTHIFNMETDVVTFLKKRTFLTATGKIVMRLTRKNITEEMKRLKYQQREYAAGRMPLSVIIQSHECWCSYARKYQAYHALVAVTDRYCKYFNIPWKEARKAWKKKR